MTPDFLTVIQIKILHSQLLHRYGGAAGVREEGLLASAVARAEQTAFYDPVPISRRLPQHLLGDC